MDDIYKNIKKQDSNRKGKILIVFDEMTADMLSNKNVNPIVTELSFWGRKLSTSLVFVTQSYFAAPENIRLNSTLYFIVIFPNKLKLQWIAPNNSPNISFKDSMNLYKKCSRRRCSFFVIDATLESDTPLCFRKNLVERI